MTGQRRYGYAYGCTVTFGGLTRTVDGTAWSLGRCDETRLRAVAQHDVSRTEDVPLGEIEITSFWYSEIITDDGPMPGHPCTDPFRPHSSPGEARRDMPDPFSPGDV